LRSVSCRRIHFIFLSLSVSGSGSEPPSFNVIMAQGVPKSIITHSQRVCRLYKSAVRTAESFLNEWHDRRYVAVVMRDRFERTRKETDMRKLAAMVEEGEHEVWKQANIQPFIYKNDPGGIMYNRVCEPSDTVLDFWHPWEKVRIRSHRNGQYETYYCFYSSRRSSIKTTSTLERSAKRSTTTTSLT